ncbi:hypothetical protein VNI00_007576 [Paramarasmius palmivorus]|uniref:CxC2-like cysteine cluster KDZ transposase-associated domain-containing protein n=1 Tax=Paramarasmius palmivorus TaxID=297713 RepID=A0AAW0D612_9AGAR
MPKSGRNRNKGRFDSLELKSSRTQKSYSSSSAGLRVSHLEVDAPVIAQPDPLPELHPATIYDWAMSDTISLPGPIETPFEETGNIEEPGRLKVKPRAKRYEDSDAPLITWKEKYRDNYLDWILVGEGRGRLFTGTCRCGSPLAKFRCLDCLALPLSCKTCLIKQHQYLPVHRTQEWSGDFFKPVTLSSLGIIVQLGHAVGEHCPHYVSGQGDFVVLGVNGIHPLNLFFCGCENAPEQYEQLLEIGWWPSSYKEPRSAATFELLRHFHILNLQGQVPPTDYYRSLEQLTDGSGLTYIPDRLQQFMLMVRQWRHLKAMKRCGRGHDPSGIAGTKWGEATVPCRCCPHPDKNLPKDWRMANAEESWKYGICLSVDANFKQKARARANDHRDPALGPGFGCFVPPEEYLQIVKDSQQNEISHCVGFNAIGKANNKKSKGLRATGIGSVTCSRHELFRPNGVGDLQKGERYCNMDAILLFSIMSCYWLLLVISYDIACQWYKNFMARMKTLPAYLHIPSFTSLKFKVPKFHLPAHVPACFAPFSFNFTKGVGKTDGEAIERNWSTLNGIARCVSMMTAGGRLDTIDDFCNFSNWRKTVNLGTSFMKKATKAIPEAIITARAFSALHDGMKRSYSDKVKQWEKEVVQWEEGRSQNCPYDVPSKKTTYAHVKRELAEEEYKREVAGKGSSAIAPGTIICEGLEIIDTQVQLRGIATSTKSTDYQQTNLLTRRTQLLGRIRRYYQLQTTHIPTLSQHIKDLAPDAASTPETLPLYLPSFFEQEAREKLYTAEQIDAEARLRYALMVERIDDLRTCLLTRAVAYGDKQRNTPSQGLYTRSQALQQQIEDKIKVIREEYKTAREAVASLRGTGPWSNEYQELRPEDIRGINERVLRQEEKASYIAEQRLAGISEQQITALLSGRSENIVTTTEDTSNVLSKREAPSWIWYSGIASGNQSQIVDTCERSLLLFLTWSDATQVLRVEWCKARARAHRAREELELLEEEMRRSISFCHWRAQWWKEQIGRRDGISRHLSEGLRAYALEQTDAEMIRAISWSTSWQAMRDRLTAIIKTVRDPGSDLDGMLRSLATLTVELDLDVADVEDVDES